MNEQAAEALFTEGARLVTESNADYKRRLLGSEWR